MSNSIISGKGTFRPMMLLVWPVLIEQLLHVMVFYVDMWLAGKYLSAESSSPISAINLAGYLMWMVFTLFAVVATGATALTARFVGAGDRRQARQVVHQAVLAGSALAVLLGAVVYPLLDQIVTLMQLEDTAHDQAVRYLQIVLPTLPFIMLIEIGFACLRGAGDMVSGLITMAIVNTVNVFVSVGLLLGVGPLPELGWEGLAYGTAAAQVVGGSIVLLLLLAGRYRLKLRLSKLRPDGTMLRRLLRIGIPGGFDSVSVVGCQLWFLGVINSLGTLHSAAHGIGVRIEALAFMPGFAFQMAAATMAGQYLGAKDEHRASRSLMYACLTGGGLMVSIGVIMFIGAVPLSEFFQGGQSTDVSELAARLVRIAAFAMPALALTMILSGGLRGAGDTRWPLVFTFIGMLGFRLPLAYYWSLEPFSIAWLGITIPCLGWGVVGAWYAMVVDVSVRCLLVLWRYWHGGWRKIEV